MERRGLRHIAVWLGLAVSAAFAYVAVSDVDFASFRRTLVEGEYLLLLPAIAVLAVAIFLRGVRWQMLFTPDHRPSLGAVMDAMLVGYLFNAVLPARAGEIARVVVLNQRAKTSRFEALATVVAERVLDVIVLLTLLVACTPFVPDSSWMRRGAILGGAALVVIVACLVLVAFRGERAVRFVLSPLLLLPNVSGPDIARAARNAVRGLAVFRRPRMAVVVLGLTALSWVVIAAVFWICLSVVGLELGPEAAVAMVIAANLSMILPSAPAGLGVFHAAVVVTLGAFGVDRAAALSYAVVVHVVNFVPLIIIGYLAFHHHAVVLRRTTGMHQTSPPSLRPPSESGRTTR